MRLFFGQAAFFGLLGACTPSEPSAALPPRLLLDVAQGGLPFQRGDHTALERFQGALHACDEGGTAPDDGDVPLVLAGCLRLTDLVLKKTSEPEGFVPRIPDGLVAPGRAHGVFIRGRACREGSPSLSWPTGYLGRLITHELGHYLGLYHSVEEDGTADLLDDTGADNLMHHRPSTVASPAFSPSQFRVMRRHPAVRLALL